MRPARTRIRKLAVLAASLVTALGGAVVVQSSASSAVVSPTADWQLQNNRASAVPGAPDLTNIGTGNKFVSATVDGTTGRRVLQFPVGRGLQVAPPTGLVNPGVYSIVILYKPASLSGYQRITDFTDGVGETGLYQLNGELVAYPNASGSGAPITTTAFHQLVLTRTAAKVMKGYVDGVEKFTFTDSGDGWLANGPNIRFFKDNASEDGVGQVARIRLYKVALTPAQVSSLDRLPADSADLAVDLVDAPDPVLHGGFLAYTATATNLGPAAAVASKVTFTIPAGASVVGSSPSVGTCAAPAGNKVTCTFGNLAPNATATALVVLNAPAATGTITGSAAVTSSTADANAVNNTASTTTRVR